jgi:hypothetical protein
MVGIEGLKAREKGLVLGVHVDYMHGMPVARQVANHSLHGGYSEGVIHKEHDGPVGKLVDSGIGLHDLGFDSKFAGIMSGCLGEALGNLDANQIAEPGVMRENEGSAFATAEVNETMARYIGQSAGK